jgi:hypothetical protein
MRTLVIGPLAAFGILLVSAISGAQGQNFSPRPDMRLAQHCVECKAKCRKCHGRGGIFKTVQACIADCDAHGNPLVNPACGVYRRC